jgi:YfiH family protein
LIEVSPIPKPDPQRASSVRAALRAPGHVHKGTIQCEAFLWFDWLDHAFTIRDSHAWAEAHAPVTLRQIHSDLVVNAAGLANRQCEGDALVTNEIGKRIGVRTADCAPLLVADPETRAVAAIHAGWRGTVSAIAQKAVARLAQEFGANPANLHVAIGPAIRGCCYEVGPEVVRQLAPLFPEWANRERRRRVDLVEANRRILVAAGIPDRQIHDCGHCTYCEHDRFFSYRRDPDDPGRMVASIARIA